ncbi:MAG: FHA domain-containing protein [Anaerolineales bacterium]|nr:FHA domain-containing protein [Anaerolineales bacterium]
MMNLKELEARLQNLIEVDLLSVLPGRKIEDVIIQKLAAAIQHNTLTTAYASTAPDVFTLIMHPDTAKHWQDQKLLAVVLHSVMSVAHEAGLRFTIAPTVTISTDEKIPRNDAEVVASHRVEAMSETNATPSPIESENQEDNERIPENAFLIVEGVKVFPLTVNVINIGRRLDNQLIIDDPRVSRNHAQLRSIKGRFVVFDLNSTGGTFVNGQRTSQSVLYPGDVISLAGVALIFGQDNPPPRPDLKDTSPFKEGGVDRPTAILKEHSTARLPKK